MTQIKITGLLNKTLSLC